VQLYTGVVWEPTQAVFQLMVDNAQKAKWYFSDAFHTDTACVIAVVGMKFLKPKTTLIP
jgi:uncharacterized protein YndB with AHSA1/START domain